MAYTNRILENTQSKNLAAVIIIPGGFVYCLEHGILESAALKTEQVNHSP